MASIGARLRWREGKLWFPLSIWRSPSKRRVPRILIEDRANEVGVLIYVLEDWVVFQEAAQASSDINIDEAIQIELYQRRYQLIPAKFKRQDSLEWMAHKDNALLFFGREGKYFIKAAKR